MMNLTILQRNKLETQVSMNLKETFENQSEGGCLEVFAKDLDDVPNNLEEKQVSLNPGKTDSV